MAMANKQYGLILPKKQPQGAAPKLVNVFGDDNASDEDDGTDWVRKALKAEGEKNRLKKQTRLDMQKALNEDPTIYQYDEVYDDLERGKGGQSDGASRARKEKKSKYIQKLLNTADRRKKEQEHRIERMVQKEREAEGEMYADKESFVTSAYRAKLEEFKKMEEEEAKMNRLEAIGDVTKQQDMSGFYRHLYEQTVDYKGETNENEGNKAEERSTEQRERKTSTSSTNGESETANKRANETEEGQRAIARSKKSRQYRQRVIETYESDSETESKEELKKDRTVASPVDKEADTAEVQEPEEKKQRLDKSHVNPVENIVDTEDRDADIPQNDDVTPESEKVESKEKPVEKKDRSSIWEKRTVGPVFEAALQRYYARKAARLTAAN